MEKLQIYIKNVIHERLKNLECFSPYEVVIKDFTLSDDSVKEIDSNEPIIYVFSLNKQETNNPYTFFRFVDSIKLKS